MPRLDAQVVGCVNRVSALLHIDDHRIRHDILRNGGVKMGWPQYVQEIVMGAVIIVAVAIDNLRNRRRS